MSEGWDVWGTRCLMYNLLSVGLACSWLQQQFFGHILQVLSVYLQHTVRQIIKDNWSIVHTMPRVLLNGTSLIARLSPIDSVGLHSLALIVVSLPTLLRCLLRSPLMTFGGVLQVTKIFSADDADDADGAFRMSLLTDAVAPFVWLTSPVRGTFSDNGFLMKEQRVDVTFLTKDKSVTAHEFLSSLSIISLMDLYKV